MPSAKLLVSALVLAGAKAGVFIGILVMGWRVGTVVSRGEQGNDLGTSKTIRPLALRHVAPLHHRLHGLLGRHVHGGERPRTRRSAIAFHSGQMRRCGRLETVLPAGAAFVRYPVFGDAAGETV